MGVCHHYTVYPKKYAHGFCFAVLCCGYTLTDFPISIRLTSLALWQSNDCPSASKATLMNIDKYFMWIHYEELHNHNKAKHNKTVCIFLGIYYICALWCHYCGVRLDVFKVSSIISKIFLLVSIQNGWWVSWAFQVLNLFMKRGKDQGSLDVCSIERTVPLLKPPQGPDSI